MANVITAAWSTYCAGAVRISLVEPSGWSEQGVSISSVSESGGPVRIGILGASSWAPTTIINPARGNKDVVVAAVGARDMSSARTFADKYGIARAHGSYDDVIADPDLDAIYSIVPTSMHGRWTRAALDAGKHVLCEKPFTANAAEAREIAELAARSDRVVMEAMQYRYHPLTFALRRSSPQVSSANWSLWTSPCVSCSGLLGELLQLLPCRRGDDGCRQLHGEHAPHVRRFDPRSCFGRG